MGFNISRFVDIEISNKTQNITLRNPRVYFFSGRCLSPVPSEIGPGSTGSCKFTNISLLWGSNGVLAFEADSFTLAIYFSNPIDYNRFSAEMGLEISRDKIHTGDLELVYDRLVRMSQDLSSGSSSFPSAVLREGQERVRLRSGPVAVTATMARGRSAVVRVSLEEGEEESRGEGGAEASGPGRHVQEK